MENFLQIKDLRHSFNNNSEVLKGIDIDVTKGEIISFSSASFLMDLSERIDIVYLFFLFFF